MFFLWVFVEQVARAGGAIGGFNGVNGGALANIGVEMAFGIGKGALTGAISGGIAAGIDGGDVGQGIVQGAKYGAIAGGTMSAMAIMAFGAAYVPENADSYGDFGYYKPVYRRGTFITHAVADGGGITIGRNLITNHLRGKGTRISEYNEFLNAHETAHYNQQINMGFGSFYSRTINEYSRYGLNNVYDINGTLEYQADQYAINKLGYFNYRGYKK